MSDGNFFDSGAVENLIASYQSTRSEATLAQILEHSDTVAFSMIRGRTTVRFESEDELISACRRKLYRVLPQYRPDKGRAFSFITRITANELATKVTLTKKYADRFRALNIVDEETSFAPADVRSEAQTRDLIDLIRGEVRSTVSATNERECQKWYVNSFIDCGFSLERYRYASAAERVFDLKKTRSRDLFDMSMLEVRRLVWDQTTHKEISPCKLRGTRETPLLFYQQFSTPAEFSKLIHLMRNLSPRLIIAVKPANEGAIQRGEREAVRENLELVWHGDPSALRLFHYL